MSNNEIQEENFEDPIKKFNTITNMESIKRSFFNKEYENFNNLVKEHNFKFFSAKYKYSDEKDDAPEFIAKNLVKGFVRNMDDYRKYLMVCFRCFKYNNENRYLYDSLWIVNSNDDLKNIIGTIYDDFEFTEVEDIDDFLYKFIKIEDQNENLENIIEEKYVH